MCPADIAVTQHLAYCADLPLSRDRHQAASHVLAAWLPAANALSAQMRASEHQTLIPATLFTFSQIREGDA